MGYVRKSLPMASFLSSKCNAEHVKPLTTRLPYCVAFVFVVVNKSTTLPNSLHNWLPWRVFSLCGCGPGLFCLIRSAL